MDIRGTRHGQTLIIVTIAVWLCLLPACSSGDTSPTSTNTTVAPAATRTTAVVTTTLPAPSPPPNVSAIVAFLNSTGAPILAFERATADLASNGWLPTRAQCATVRSRIASLTTNPAKLLQLVRRVPDPLLSAELTAAIDARALVFGTCGHSTAGQVRTAQAASSALDQRLMQVGIKID
jgi:hypothetical protein